MYLLLYIYILNILINNINIFILSYFLFIYDVNIKNCYLNSILLKLKRDT
jgi:hypothetical protein